MDDNLFLNGLANSLQAHVNANELVKGLVQLRNLYNGFVDISEDNSVSDEERYEAKELTKDGFYSMMRKISDMT